MMPPRYLTIDEKRDWLASVFRDSSGEYSQSDKFKAMIEDTKLALLLAEEEKKETEQMTEGNVLNHHLLAHLPPPRLVEDEGR